MAEENKHSHASEKQAGLAEPIPGILSSGLYYVLLYLALGICFAAFLKFQGPVTKDAILLVNTSDDENRLITIRIQKPGQISERLKGTTAVLIYLPGKEQLCQIRNVTLHEEYADVVLQPERPLQAATFSDRLQCQFNISNSLLNRILRLS